MSTIKAFTDLSQSKKLAEILPLESADMCWQQIYDENHMMSDYRVELIPYRLYSGIGVPCWSLAALLNIIPTMIGSVFEKDALRLRIDKSETDFNIWYDNLDTGMVEEGLDIIKSNTVDACYEMIIRLHELKMF